MTRPYYGACLAHGEDRVRLDETGRCPACNLNTAEGQYAADEDLMAPCPESGGPHTIVLGECQLCPYRVSLDDGNLFSVTLTDKRGMVFHATYTTRSEAVRHMYRLLAVAGPGRTVTFEVYL